MNSEISKIVPDKYWFTLKEACVLKGLNYKTACNRVTELQPNHGIPDGKVGGRKVFNRETVIAWIALSDEEL